MPHKVFQLFFDSLKNFDISTRNNFVTYKLPKPIYHCSKINLKSLEFPSNVFRNIVQNSTDSVGIYYPVDGNLDNFIHENYDQNHYNGDETNTLWDIDDGDIRARKLQRRIVLKPNNYQDLGMLHTDLNIMMNRYVPLQFSIDIEGHVVLLLMVEPHIIPGYFSYYNNHPDIKGTNLQTDHYDNIQDHRPLKEENFNIITQQTNLMTILGFRPIDQKFLGYINTTSVVVFYVSPG